MRSAPLALALLIVACGGNERGEPASVANAPSVASSRGPDLLAFRVPRKGGTPHVHAYPALDSLVWRAQGQAPALARILALDETGGALAAIDERGVPVRIDFRLGAVSRQGTPKLEQVASADGYAIFGLDAKDNVVRLTPASGADWTHEPKLPVRELLPQPDGSLVLVADSASRTIVWQLRPPESRVARSLVLDRTERAIRTPVGDRIYFISGQRLLAVRTRDLEPVPAIELPAVPRSLVTSPSGDRMYVIADSSRQLFVIDRYSEGLVDGPELPGFPRELRMDPMGRLVLIRAAEEDSVWVLDVGADRLIGAVRSQWRADLPAVAPDGRIVVARGPDVVLLDGDRLTEDTIIAGGASDFWYLFTWDGFRPAVAAREEEAPVEPLPEVPDDTVANPFAGQLATRDSGVAVEEIDTLPAPVAQDAPAAPAVEYTLQFGALRDEDAAQDLAREIRDARSTPRVMATVRVVSTTVADSEVFRVIAGPFRTRPDAESAGQRSGKPYWVYEGAP